MKTGLLRRLGLLALLALLTLSLSPAMADKTIDLSAVNGDVMITEGGTYTLTGTLSGWPVIVEASKEEKVELVLSGAVINNPHGAAINCREAKDLIITLAEGTVNALTGDKPEPFDDPDKEEPSAALFSKADLIIRGTGSLEVYGNWKHGIASKDDLRVEEGTLTVRSASDAVRGKDSVEIEGGTLLLEAGKDGISATNSQEADRGYVQISGGIVTVHAAGDGIQAETDLIILGGTFDITTDGVPSGSSNSQRGLKAGCSITLGGGSLRLDTQGDAVHADMNVTIAGGEIVAISGGDTLDANGDILVKGGKLRLTSPAEPPTKGALMCDQGITITGGDIGFAGNTGAEISMENQPLLLVSFASVRSPGILTLRDGNGTLLMEVKAGDNFNFSGFSSPEMKTGETYSVFRDDEKITEVTLTDSITRAKAD